MITVSRILKAKSSEIFQISPDDSVYDAIKLMSDKNVGALLVLSNNTLVGVFSERDFSMNGIGYQVSGTLFQLKIKHKKYLQYLIPDT